MNALRGANLPEVLSAVESLLTCAAIIVGALWAYYHFARKRVYRLRVKLAISGELIRGMDGSFLLVRCTLENSGVSKVALQAEGSGFNVSSAAMEVLSDQVDLVNWAHVGTFDVFSAHKWIEAGGVVSEDHLLDLRATGDKPILLELRVVAGRISFTSQSVVWRKPEIESRKNQ